MLPVCDYVINPYVGCTHGCKYCYASFMKRFTGHREPWGTFLDIKESERDINIKKLEGKTVFLSSVTDPYNHCEKKYEITRKILEQLVNADCKINITTKSKLVLRDLDILKKMKNVSVGMSINTLDESFRKDMDNASTIQERLNTLETLHHEGIYTILFMSPIFPFITDFKEIIEVSSKYVNEYWFENLNLRGDYKTNILNYIKQKYPEYYTEYEDIYIHKRKGYWFTLSEEIEDYCKKHNIKYTNFFYHEKLVEKKKQNW